MLMRNTRSTTAGAALLTAITIACACDGASAKSRATPDSGSASSAPARTPTYNVQVVRSFPHDPEAFTQGLVWQDGHLFESTGRPGQSSIREVDLESGRVIRKRDVPAPHFGEGIALFGDKLIELTWTSNVAFVYDMKTFEPKGQFKYDGEGWGLTTDGTLLIMSDGTSTIRFRDPNTFVEKRSIAVSEHGLAVSKINELEWVKGEIWANVWESDQIARINPTTGNVVGWINLTGLLPKLDRRGNEDVLNGIAYDAKTDRLFVTGKLWSRLFEIRLQQRS